MFTYKSKHSLMEMKSVQYTLIFQCRPSAASRPTRAESTRLLEKTLQQGDDWLRPNISNQDFKSSLLPSLNLFKEERKKTHKTKMKKQNKHKNPVTIEICLLFKEITDFF